MMHLILMEDVQCFQISPPCKVPQIGIILMILKIHARHLAVQMQED